MARPLSRYLDPKSKDVIYFKKDLIKYDGKHKEKGRNQDDHLGPVSQRFVKVTYFIKPIV